MKKSALVVLLVCLLAYCKDKNNQPEPLPEVAGIVGKWRMVSYEYIRGDSITILSPPSSSEIVAFRYDGIPLDSLGRTLCCPPSSYVMNGEAFVIKQIGEAPPYNSGCSFVDCVGCAEWKLIQEGDQLSIERCNFSKATYKRLR